MSANPGRAGATTVGIIVLVLVFLIFLSPGHKQTTVQPPASARHTAGERRFSGQGNRDLSRIVVSVASSVIFDCSRCVDSGFAITSSNPKNPSQGLNDATPGSASAQFIVSPGTYSSVQIKTGGNPWTLTITPDPGG